MQMRAVGLVAILVLTACGGDLLPTAAPTCDEAFAAAAAADVTVAPTADLTQDTVEHLYPTVRACESVVEWVGGVAANPGAIETNRGDVRVFLGNVCVSRAGLEGTELCQQVLASCGEDPVWETTLACLPEGPAPTRMADPTAQARYVSEAGGWSVVLPPGWELIARHNQGDIALTGAGGLAEVLVSPTWGLGLEQLKARTVADLSAWPGAIDVEAEVVRLPAGDAVWATLKMSSPEHGPAVFTLYAIDDGDHHYAISVRGSGDGAQLLAVAKALAESFAISD